ncbi:MAG: myxosortase-dependent M36 family metallopeptidase [Myxococcales bacterium]|nr:myxosortase-dependent M36 family metallopeptidase [Myxococcales bacterium]
MRPLPVLLLAQLLTWSAAAASRLTNLDAFLESKAATPLPSAFASALTRERVLMGRVAHLERRLAVPTFFWSGAGGPSLRASGLSPEQAARRYLFELAELYRAQPQELAEATLARLHDTGEGALIATFRQELGGIPLFRDEMKVAMDRELRLVAVSGYLSPHASARSATSRLQYDLDHPTAVAVAWMDLTGEPLQGTELVELGIPLAGWRTFVLDPRRASPSRMGTPARVRKVLFGLPDGLEPAYHLELDAGPKDATESDYFAYVVSARDGRLLFRQDLTADGIFSYRVWAETSGKNAPFDGPQDDAASPHPTGTPNGYQAPFVSPNLVTLASGPISTADSWLAAGATETTGNNAEAYGDLVSPDGFGPGDLRATATATGAFDRTYDTAAGPAASSDQRMAAITQLFYDVNFLHDWFYDVGFDEAAGNAQADNYGRGGLDGDSLRAEGQDYSGRNNANMSTPSDGARPRMQQFIWDGRTQPPPFGRRVRVLSPSSIAADYDAGAAGFGPRSFDIQGGLVLAADLAPSTSLGCTSDGGIAFSNASALSGNVALVDRGTCTFVTKARNAQQCGAIGIVIANNADGGSAMSMSGTDSSITIPVLSVSTSDGALFKATLGTSPMTVGLYREAVIDRDSTIDNTVVAHEWGHYISNRLIGDANGLSNTIGRGMGEGWGDFHALLLMVRAQDAQLPQNVGFKGAYVPAAYVSSGGGSANQGYYFGIRRFPLSTDFAKNALTFRHVADGEALPSGVPSDPNGLPNSEVHNAGEIWATMLWECYAALLNTPRLTFQQAQDRMRRYLVAAYKLTPVTPTLLEARDALLAAAYANDVQDFTLFASAFARRGAGIRAVAPDRDATDNRPVVESFVTGPDLAVAKVQLDDGADWCDKDGVLDSGETGSLSLTVKNTGTAALTATTATASTATLGATLSSGSLAFPTIPPLGSAKASVEVSLTGATAISSLALQLSATDPGLAIPGPVGATAAFRVHSDEVLASSATDDVEPSGTAWTVSRDASLPGTTLFARKELSVFDHLYYGANPPATADTFLTSPPLLVSSTGTFGFTFRHRYDFEASGTTYFDGGVIELSDDGGQTWQDIGSSATPGYNVTLTNPANGTNPLKGRPAFGGTGAGYPAFLTATVSLGTAYQGKTVRVRFRMGADGNTAGAGWELDDLAFTGITNTPFPTLVADRAICVNRRPVANAGAGFAADERTVVTLSGSGTDPENDPLTYAWAQVAGPSAPLSGATTQSPQFTAPEVSADTALTFELVVNDGTSSSKPSPVVVTVRHINRPPLADAGPAFAVDERTANVQLAGSGSDPDGDSLTFTWSQVSGPPVSLSGAASATASFDAPEVSSGAVLAFQLVVSDGKLPSSPSLVQVTVRQVNQPPSANAGEAIAVDERTRATLTGAGSDPDGDPVSFRWRQLSGPLVALAGAGQQAVSFYAPEVSLDTVLELELTASDGRAESAPSAVRVTVRQVNRGPIARPFAERLAGPGTRVLLHGSPSKDLDGDPLSFEWRQTGGPEVVLEDADRERASFTAPLVRAEETVSLELVVSDGALSSEPAAIDILVKAEAPLSQGCGCGGAPGMLGGAALALAALLRGRRRPAGGAWHSP